MEVKCLADQNKLDAACQLAFEARQECESELESQTVRKPEVAKCMFLLALALRDCNCFEEAKKTVEKTFLLPADETVDHSEIVLLVLKQGINIGKRQDAAILAKEARKRKAEMWGMSSSRRFILQHFSLLRCYSS